jgi:mRNA-degrading endonuclease RelE of RelBE toxin-antitoxin system
MPYQVVIKPQAEKAILELPRKDQENVFREIRAIAVDPKKTGVKPLATNSKGSGSREWGITESSSGSRRGDFSFW